MKIGTKSILFGAHQFLIHPLFVALAWWRLYGFPLDWRLWACFFVHDLGYWGLPNMDGPEGEKHVLWGAWKAHMWCDERRGGRRHPMYWHDMCLLHSRYWAQSHGRVPSRLCYADKLAFVITPSIIYLPMVWLTGEWREYAAAHDHECHADNRGLLHWYRTSKAYVRRWVEEHRYGKEDTWTVAKPNLSNRSRSRSL